MKKSLIEIYALAVCFASIFFLIVWAAAGLHGTLRAVRPAMTMDGYTYERSLSDEAFMQTWPKERPSPDPSSVPGLRKAAYEQALQIEQRAGLHNLVSSLTYLLAAGLAFSLHWKLAQREHATTPVATAQAAPGGQ
jgi:hypothetical protein